MVDLRRLRRVRAVCPTGADGEEPAQQRRQAHQHETKSVDTLCPIAASAARPVHVKDNKILYIDGRDGPANNNRLCVKGRFGRLHPSPR